LVLVVMVALLAAMTVQTALILFCPQSHLRAVVVEEKPMLN
jgi:hypothetical protein